MKKFAYVIAALAAIAVAAPSIASAETVVVRHGDMHRDHWHPHHHEVVVVRHGHHHHGY
jgi:oxalate decarboxylase/phosphoglucose isomerase-like protein (cupin superfamily)